MSNENSDDGYKMFMIILFFLIFCVAGIFYWLDGPRRQTSEAARAMARTAMDDLPNGAEVQNDAWGKPMKFQRIANEKQVTQIITSAGKDGKFGTSDDIIQQDTDWNKSRIVGKWVASRTKEFVKGLKDGEHEPTRFDRFSHSEQPTTKPTLWQRLKGKTGE